MKIINITSPQMLKYCVAPNFIKYIEEQFLNKECEEVVGDKLRCNLGTIQDSNLLELLLFFKEQSENLTIGNKKKYSREIDVLRSHRGKQFIIDTDNRRFHGTMDLIDMENGDIIVEFIIDTNNILN